MFIKRQSNIQESATDAKKSKNTRNTRGRGKLKQKDKKNKVNKTKVGEEYDLEVIGFGRSGDPFGKVDGCVTFVKGCDEDTKVGQRIFVKVNKVGASVNFAEKV